ncbi:MAG: hypothetical protein AAF501_15525, partial [Pseudomonadota bacterium]
DDLDVDATICRVYSRMMHSFEQDTAGWTAPDFVEIPYARLDAAPMETLKQIYAGLELDGFDAAAPIFSAYLDSVRSFQKNAFRGDAASVRTVSEAWGHWIDKWGYDTPVPA